MPSQFDNIIVGAGQAGPALAFRFAAAGQTVALVERHLFGGTCVNTGCTPTKTMIASAYAARVIQRADEYGFSISPGTVDISKIHSRRDALVTASRDGMEKALKNTAGITVFKGTGSFEGPDLIRVGSDLLKSKRIFLNVGGRAYVPQLPGLDEVPFLTNSSLLALNQLPKHLVIVGGSYIGLEFAQMYHRFGSEVTVIEKADRLVSCEDEDVSAAVLDILEREGIKVRLNAECIHLAAHEEGVLAGVSCRIDERPVVGSHVLLAVGRMPNTQDLGLDAAGVRTDEKGFIKVDDQCRTNVPGVYALGDCNGRGGFTHTAYNDFEIAAGNILDNDPRRISDRISCYAMYIDPPLARIGMTEREVRRSGRAALIGTRQMTAVGRAREKGETLGFMKVLVDAETKKILGASLLGVGCDEAIHCLLDLMYADAPYSIISRAVHIHPTVSELIPTLLQGLKPLTSDRP